MFTLVAVQLKLVVVVMFTGHVITGATASITVTVCMQTAVFPDASATVQVTGVIPTGKVDEG